jgi:type II secretory pathway component PulF
MSNPQDLPATLRVVCELYERQTELRLERIQLVITPLLVILIAVLIGAVIFGILLPLNAFLQEILSATMGKK